MKFSVSNLAWNRCDENYVLSFLKSRKIRFFEAAPSKLVGFDSFNDENKANFISKYYNNLNMEIISLQSIFYGSDYNIFGSIFERNYLLELFKNAIKFSYHLGSKNIVFGSPKNRFLKSSSDKDIAISFFKEISSYAQKYKVTVSIEPNPEIYKTNFLNTISETLDFIGLINSKYLSMNLDIGEIIQNNENFSLIENNIHLINHVHISRPFLEMPILDPITQKTLKILKENQYKNFLSIEVKPYDKLIFLNTVEIFLNFIEGL